MRLNKLLFRATVLRVSIGINVIIRIKVKLVSIKVRVFVFSINHCNGFVLWKVNSTYQINFGSASFDLFLLA